MLDRTADLRAKRKKKKNNFFFRLHFLFLVYFWLTSKCLCVYRRWSGCYWKTSIFDASTQESSGKPRHADDLYILNGD